MDNMENMEWKAYPFERYFTVDKLGAEALSLENKDGIFVFNGESSPICL